MSKEQWLAYLRVHPGTVEVSTLLVDIIQHQARAEAIDTVSTMLGAYGARVIEINSHKE